MNITRQVALSAVAFTMLITAMGSARAQTIDWVRQFGTPVRDVASGLAVDSTGNIYVVGETSGLLPGAGSAGVTGAFLARFDLVGNLIWVRPSGATAAVAVDGAGFIYVAGGSLVAKYDPSGVQQWTRTFDVAGFSSVRVSSVATDLAGNVYVVGNASQAIAPPPSSQNVAFLGKYDPSGTQLWFQTPGAAPLLQPPTYIGIATADTGHVYIAGWTNQQSPSTSMTLNVRQYDLAGNAGWSAGYVDPSSHAQGAGIATDTSGNIYVSGWTIPRFSSTTEGKLLVRFDTAGNRLWVQTLPGDVFGGQLPSGVIADSRGNVYLVGGATILAFDSSGAQLWARQIGDPEIVRITRVAVDASGALYLSGYTRDALPGATALGQEDAFVMKMLPPATAGYYEIVSRNSDKCLDVYGASIEAAAPVIQWTCHGGQNQQWRLEPADDGTFSIVARHSGLALDVYGALVDDLAPVIQYPAHGGDNQRWTIEPASDGYVRITARHSGRVLDVEGGSVDDGAQVIQYIDHGGANQQWLLRAVADLSSSQ